MSNSSSTTTTLLSSSSTTVPTSTSEPNPFPFTDSYSSAAHYFPADVNYLFNNYTIFPGFDSTLLFLTETISQSIGASAALSVSPVAGFDVSRGLVLSRIANCPERDPLYYTPVPTIDGQRHVAASSSDVDLEQGGVRWIQRTHLQFPDTLLPISWFGFGPEERGFALRVAILSWLILIVLPVIFGWLFVKPVAPTGKTIAMFFAVTLCLGWGFSSGILLGSVATLNSPIKNIHFLPIVNPNATLSQEDFVIIDWVLGIVPVCLPLLAMLYYSKLLQAEIKTPVEEKSQEELQQALLENEEKDGKTKKNSKNSNRRNRHRHDDDDDDEEEDEEDQQYHEQKTSNNNNNDKNKPQEKLDAAELKAKKRAEEDLRKRNQKKPPLHVVISKVQFNTPGVAKKAPWKIKLRDWMNSSRFAKLLFLGNYCWKGGELPVIEELMSFEELEQLKKERIARKKKKEEEDKKNGIKKKKGFFDQLSESDNDDDEGKKAGGAFTGMISRYGLSKRNFFDDPEDEDTGGGGGGGGGFFDDDAEIPVVTEEGQDSDEENKNDENKEEESAGVKNEDDEEPEKEETEDEKKKRELLENPKLDIVLPERPKLSSAQVTYNRLGLYVDMFYGPPEPLSIEEANRRQIRLPWKEIFVTFTPHYTTFNAILTTVFSLFCGLAAACPECFCENNIVCYVAIILTGLDVAFVVVTRPFLIPIQNLLSISSNGVVIAAAVLSLVPRDELFRLYLVQSLCLVVVPAIGLAKIVFAFTRSCLLYFGNLEQVSIYHGKTNREIKLIQKKLRKTEENVSVKRQREYEVKTSTVQSSKKGGMYHRAQSAMDDGNFDDDEELFVLPRKSSSKFRRRAKSRNNDDDDGGAEDNDNNNNVPSASPVSSSSPSSPAASSSKKSSRRKLAQNNNDDEEDDAEPEIVVSPRTPRARRAQSNRSIASDLATSRNKGFVDSVDI